MLVIHVYVVLFEQEFGFIHLSAGDLLREARDSGSPDGKLIDDYIRNGKIVPVEITISLLQKVSICSLKLKAFLYSDYYCYTYVLLRTSDMYM